MNKKVLLGFLAGAFFVLGLLVTCGGSKNGGTRTASAGGGTAWEFAEYDSSNSSIELPTTATRPDLLSCATRVCALNLIGADGWELVAHTSTIYSFKRPK